MILSSIELKDRLAEAISTSTSEIQVFSAFITDSALKWALDKAKHSNISIVSRWQKRDIVCGASNISCYKICRGLGIPFGINLDLHGKVFCVDDYIFIGSANMTSKGLALSSNHNIEFGVGFEAGVADKNKIRDLKKEILWLNDEIFEKIEKELDASDRDVSISQQRWSTELTEIASKPVHYLWMHELVFSTPQELLHLNLRNETAAHDFDLMGLDLDVITESELKNQFRKTRVYKWLIGTLVEQKSVSFGGLTAALHAAILDDPAPYRVEVKKIITNLYSWAKLIDEEFAITRPNHSEILSLK